MINRVDRPLNVLSTANHGFRLFPQITSFIIADFYKISIKCGGRVSQQPVAFPMGINCASLFAGLFLHYYNFIADLIRKK